jgi:hypothetical protein
MKLELLSDNLIIILQEIMKQQNLCKLINYNESTPLAQTDLVLPASSLLRTSLFPYSSDDETIVEDCVQLRVWVYTGNFKGADISINDVFLDIVIAKSLFLITIDGEPKLRPYEIMKELINTFDGINISTLGRLNFKTWHQLSFNESKFITFRIRAEMMLI